MMTIQEYNEKVLAEIRKCEYCHAVDTKEDRVKIKCLLDNTWITFGECKVCIEKDLQKKGIKL